MKRNNKIRDLIYVSGKAQEGLFVFYGIEFHEFIRNLNKPVTNLLLLKHNYQHADFHYPTRLEYVSDDKIQVLAMDDSYGNFSWLDFEQLTGLDKLTPLEMAEILYFSHFAEPLRKVFFRKLKNNFAYYGHDDGWYSRVYFNDIFQFSHILANVIVDKTSIFTKRKIRPINDQLTNQLLELTSEGLFIDFQKIVKDRSRIDIPFTAVGHHTHMDKVYDLRYEIEQFPLSLRYEKGNWFIHRS